MLARVKEILKEKGLRMSDLADRLGQDQSNLQKSLGKNPTLSTLEQVAKALSIPMSDLFSPSPSYHSVKRIAILEDGKTYGILAVPGIVQIPCYENYTVLRQFVTDFVKKSVTSDKTDSICGLMEAIEFFCLVYDGLSQKYLLSICYDEKKMLTYAYNILKYQNMDTLDIEMLCENIINDIEGTAITKMASL